MEALLVGSRVVKLDFAGTLSFYPEARTELPEVTGLPILASCGWVGKRQLQHAP